MKKASLFVAVVVCVFTSLDLVAQENFTLGPVSRIVLIRIRPGHNSEFWADVRQNLKPTFEEYKKQGIITDYMFFTKSTTENPTDWTVGYGLTYKNWAALDDLAQRTDPITLKHYGSAQARTEAGRKRVEHGELVSSFLIRNVDPRPMPGATTPRP
ncbi:MAG TPA: hypothetical protein VGK04_11105 [Thermoanaerobaculia bacterium]|jgi:hypothetical protein